MAERIVQEESLVAVADAIRAKGGTSGALSFPAGFADAIAAIQAGGGGGEVTMNGYTVLSGAFTVSEDISTDNYYYVDCAAVAKPSVMHSLVYIADGFPDNKDTVHIIGGCGLAYKNYSDFACGGAVAYCRGDGADSVATGSNVSYMARHINGMLRIGIRTSASRVLAAGVTYGWIFLYK